jgi:arylsulfatase A-like enzyme
VSGPQSLILITVDCLRADHTGFMGYARPTTPFLDVLAGENLVFPKAIVVGAPTYYSFPGIMASRYPLALGRDVIGIAPGEPTLATVLQQAGYRTAAYIAGNPYLANRFGYAQGFDVFQDFLSDELRRSGESLEPSDSSPRAWTRLNNRVAEVTHRVGPLGRLYDELYFQYRQRIAASRTSWDALRCFPAADVLVDQAGDWLRSIGNQPFFLWLHFMDPHAPYYPAAEALSAVGAERIRPGRARYLNAAWTEMGGERLRNYRGEIVQLYDAGIRWVDTQVGRLVEMLRKLSLWDSSVFALTSDHGEEFLDHGGRFHYASRAYQEMLHVPLLLRSPGVRKTGVSDAPFSHIHLAPTLLDAVGMDAPSEFEGRSYWNEARQGEDWEYAVSESIGRCTNPMDAAKRIHGRVLAVQDRRYKMVLDFDNNSEELFDLGSDPRELRALSAEADKASRAPLLRVASQHLTRGAREVNRERALRARVREIGLEWKHSKMDSKTLAS